MSAQSSPPLLLLLLLPPLISYKLRMCEIVGQKTFKPSRHDKR